MFNIWQYYRPVPLPTDEHCTAIDRDGDDDDDDDDGDKNKDKITVSNCISHDGKGTGHTVFKMLSSTHLEKQENQGISTDGRLPPK